jgi:hypothetical protein
MIRPDLESELHLYRAGSRRLTRAAVIAALLLAAVGIVLIQVLGGRGNYVRGGAMFLFALLALAAALRIQHRTTQIVSAIRNAEKVQVAVILTRREDSEGISDTYVQLEALTDRDPPLIPETGRVEDPLWEYQSCLGRRIAGEAFRDRASGEWLAVATEHGFLFR